MNSLRGAKKQELGGIALNEFTLGNISRILENFQVCVKTAQTIFSIRFYFAN